MRTNPLNLRSFGPALALTLGVILVIPCRADHGPGTSGGGFSTQSAETLKPRQWSASVHLDWTEFEAIGSEDVVGLDHFDLLDRSYLFTFGASVGITENLQVGIAFGYYAANGSRRIPHSHSSDGDDATHAETSEDDDGEEHTAAAGTGHHHAGHQHVHVAHGPGVLHTGGHGSPGSEDDADAGADAEVGSDATHSELASFDPDGWTDLWLTAKYRLYRGPAGQFAVFGGIKFPVGETRVLDSTGARVEPASMPGTGAWDEMIGAAYTFPAGPGLVFDASAQYIFRGEKFNYRLGNRFDAGLAAGWRCWTNAGAYPQLTLVAEASVRHIEKSREHGEKSHSTGGTAVFLSPGIRVAFGPHIAWSAGVQIPLLQDLNGHQLKTLVRISTSLGIVF